MPSDTTLSQRSDGNSSYRVLIVDDNPSIHEDFRKILCPVSISDPRSVELESQIFGTPANTGPVVAFELDSAFQGQSALEKLNHAIAQNRPYSFAFVDIQMPPGWDGIETVNRLWEVYPALQVVICTAYSTYSWEEMRSILKQTDSLLVLKKPFDEVEIQQMAHTLARKWELNLLAGIGLNHLDDGIRSLLIDRDTRVGEKPALATSYPDGNQIVTDLKLLSETLEATRARLRHAEQQLVHSEKMASLSRLSAGILHEINNPLNYSMAALSMLEKSAADLPDDCREYHLDTLKDIRDGFNRMTEITNGLRKFAHPEMGDLRKIQVDDSVRTALRLMSVEIGDGIAIENDIPDSVFVWGAGSRLCQLFINLIHNSTYSLRKKVQPPGTNPRILFEAARNQGRIIISVSDNGQGIPSGEIGKIFDPFYTTKEVGEAVGFGLGICHRILKEFGATISAESEQGISTRFNLSFPDPDSYTPPKKSGARGLGSNRTMLMGYARVSTRYQDTETQNHRAGEIRLRIDF